MPEPQSGEQHDEFMERCIPMVIDEGTAKDGTQAYAVCQSMWEAGMKADNVSIANAAIVTPNLAVKVAGDWELDVLGVPFGGPNGGKDDDGEYFSEKTNLHLDRFADPLVMYYHGYGDNGEPAGEPQVIGKVASHEKRSDGVWFRVILDKASEFARRVWEGAKDGMARASSGSINHLVRKADDGEILNWPMAELSLFETSTGKQPANGYAVALPVLKAIYTQAGHEWPQEITEDIEMDEIEVKAAVDAAVKAALAQQEAEAKAKAEQEAEIQARVDAAVKAAEEKYAAEKRLPTGAPNVNLHGDIDKYDNLDPGEHAFFIQTYEALRQRRGGPQLSDSAIKAFAMKLEAEEAQKTDGGKDALKMLKAKTGDAVKAYEINYSTYNGYGDQWVGVMYHTDLWEKIRTGTWVLQDLERGGDVRMLPDGYESDVVALEGGDPTWYKVAQATAHDSTSGRPVATITSSNIGTSQGTVSLNKMGCRVIFTGELVEDSLIRWVPNAYRQIQVSGQEIMEHALIDGDTSSANVTNINHIGAQPTGNEAYTLCDGFRKLALVTNSTNSRDGGVLTVEDYLETVKLMGSAGKNASDPTKVTFIVDPSTYWKTLELDEVKTRDVFATPTIENGLLSGLWGFPVRRSYFMHYAGVVAATVTTAAYMNKANSAGKVDQTTEANNTKGAILAVRWDQWALRWKRRMTLEVDRWPEADANQIVAMLRWGLAYRDNEASAITYNVTV